jgi:hypothetical protein
MRMILEYQGVASQRSSVLASALAAMAPTRMSALPHWTAAEPSSNHETRNDDAPPVSISPAAPPTTPTAATTVSPQRARIPTSSAPMRLRLVTTVRLEINHATLQLGIGIDDLDDLSS